MRKVASRGRDMRPQVRNLGSVVNFKAWRGFAVSVQHYPREASQAYLSNLPSSGCTLRPPPASVCLRTHCKLMACLHCCLPGLPLGLRAWPACFKHMAVVPSSTLSSLEACLQMGTSMAQRVSMRGMMGSTTTGGPLASRLSPSGAARRQNRPLPRRRRRCGRRPRSAPCLSICEALDDVSSRIQSIAMPNADAARPDLAMCQC